MVRQREIGARAQIRPSEFNGRISAANSHLAPLTAIRVTSGASLRKVTSRGGAVMATNAQQLESFVKESLQAGHKREEVTSVLGRAGWPEAQIRNALDAFSDEPFPVPVPKPRPSLSARDAFLYLVMFGTLYYGVWNLVTPLLLFHRSGLSRSGNVQLLQLLGSGTLGDRHHHHYLPRVLLHGALHWQADRTQSFQTPRLRFAAGLPI